MPTRPKIHRPTASAKQPERGTRQQRGYDKDWYVLQRWWRRNHPLCVECKKEGRDEEATQVDHIVPFRGKDDPLRLDEKNLQGLCATHHSEKTRREGRTRQW